MAPPNTTQLAQKEGQIVLAAQAFKQGHFRSLRAAACVYDCSLYLSPCPSY
jgi:hypothetical protein